MSNTEPKKRKLDLNIMMDDINTYIETPKEVPAPTNATAAAVQNEPAVEQIAEKKETSCKEPNKQFRRNITLSEEMFWCLNYIKDRKNKNRSEGDKFVGIDGLMFEMIQQTIDNQYPSVKKKFEDYKKEDSEDWM